MTGFPLDALLRNLALAAAAIAALQATAFAIGRRWGRHDVVDVTWGLAFALVAVVTLVASSGHGEPGRTALVVALTVAWGLRLALHIGRRMRGRGPDPRYQRLLAPARGNPTWSAVLRIHLPQAALVWLVSLPVQVAAYTHGGVWAVAAAGAVVWAVGLFFEAVGDAQLSRFKADPANRGAIMDRGLWAWTRHPNYFGDACVWWGIWLVAASAWPGALTVVSPVVMTFLLTRGSGVRLMEEHMRGRPGWQQYTRRTSRLVPTPPRHGDQSR